jgi:hypothetical protein
VRIDQGLFMLGPDIQLGGFTQALKFSFSSFDLFYYGADNRNLCCDTHINHTQPIAIAQKTDSFSRRCFIWCHMGNSCAWQGATAIHSSTLLCFWGLTGSVYFFWIVYAGANK